MKTQKLYYTDAYTKSFEALVLTCEKTDKSWLCTLDQSAFFPCEGGQSADTGTLGGRLVLDVQEKNGVLLHELSGPLTPGQRVKGELSWPERFRKMQSHSAEHILSGLIHRHFGYENTGFHLSDRDFIFDCGGELSREQLQSIEWQANLAVWENKAVKTWFPAPEELAGIEYRSKLELTENVRLVQIGDVDICACCAPHVARTGEIGLIKLTDAMRHRGGMRIHAKAGSDAMDEFCSLFTASGDISRQLSVPRDRIERGVDQILQERDRLLIRLNRAQNDLLQRQIASLQPCKGNMLLFADCDNDGLRQLCNAGAPLSGGVCAAFSGSDGDYRFVIAARSQSAAEFLAAHKDGLKARGGGKAEMVSGSSSATREEIEKIFA